MSYFHEKTGLVGSEQTETFNWICYYRALVTIQIVSIGRKWIRAKLYNPKNEAHWRYLDRCNIVFDDESKNLNINEIYVLIAEPEVEQNIKGQSKSECKLRIVNNLGTYEEFVRDNPNKNKTIDKYVEKYLIFNWNDVTSERF